MNHVSAAFQLPQPLALTSSAAHPRVHVCSRSSTFWPHSLPSTNVTTSTTAAKLSDDIDSINNNNNASDNSPSSPSVASRRDFLRLATATSVLLPIADIPFPYPSKAAVAATTPTPTFELPPLPYPYDGLEPRISSTIMRYHHDFHFASYTNNLNAVVEEIKSTPNNRLSITDDDSLKSALRNLRNVSPEFQSKLRNNGGGYLNHKQFFSILSPAPTPLTPASPFAKAIDKWYGSFDDFKRSFIGQAMSVFGSGFTWLVVEGSGNQLSVYKTANQDNPLMTDMTPIIPCDCWEHAWYSQYGPKKKEYFEMWWACIDWKAVEDIYAKAIK